MKVNIVPFVEQLIKKLKAQDWDEEFQGYQENYEKFSSPQLCEERKELEDVALYTLVSLYFVWAEMEKRNKEIN